MTMELFVQELKHFSAVAAMLIFSVAFFIRWKQSYRVSHGHFVVGMGAVGMTFVALLVTMFAFEFVTGFLILCLLASGIWLVYNDWYFFRYPVPDSILTNLTDVKTIGKDTRLARFLRQSQREQTAVFGPRTMILASSGVVFLLLTFGFYRVVTAIATGERRAVAAQKMTASQVTREVKKSKAELEQSIQEVADTITANQKQVIDLRLKNAKLPVVIGTTGVDPAILKQMKRLERKVDQNGAELKRARAIDFNSVQPLLPVAPTGVISPDRVKTPPPVVPAKRRGKLFGYDGEEYGPYLPDTLASAREN